MSASENNKIMGENENYKKVKDILWNIFRAALINGRELFINNCHF